MTEYVFLSKRSHSFSGSKDLRAGGGFTLIEIIVSVSIISMLLMLAVPALQSAREAGRTIKCAAHMKQMGVAAHSFCYDYGFLPPGRVFKVPELHWTVLLTEHVGGDPIEYEDDVITGENLDIFACPSAAVPNVGPLTRITHYSAHKVLMPSQGEGGGWTGKRYKTEQVRRPDEVILLADGVQMTEIGENGNAGNAYHNFRRLTPTPYQYFSDNDTDLNDPIIENSMVDDEITPFDNTDSEENYRMIRYRHHSDSATNVTMADGHVETIQQGHVLNRNIRTNR